LRLNLSGWKEKLFQRYLIWNCRPSKVRSSLKAYLPSALEPEPANRSRVRVAALQVELQLCKSPLEYIKMIHRRVREAHSEGARLVVFPEYHNLSLFGLLPGIEALAESYRDESTHADQDHQKSAEEEISLNDLFRFMTPAVRPLVMSLFSTLSAAYRLYIMAGSYILADESELFNRAFLFGPDGKLIGCQDKVHLLPVESEWKLERGSRFNLFETDLGRLAIPVCMDATYYETFRTLENHNAEIALLPIANLEDYNYWLALRGVWPRVQESPIYGVKSALVGSIAGLNFTGRAGIYAPLELTPTRNGVLAEVENYAGEAMAIADLNLEALDELRQSHPWRDQNQSLYNKYFPQIYDCQYKP
jgi:predicted amidohydrolase